MPHFYSFLTKKLLIITKNFFALLRGTISYNQQIKRENFDYDVVESWVPYFLKFWSKPLRWGGGYFIYTESSTLQKAFVGKQLGS